MMSKLSKIIIFSAVIGLLSACNSETAITEEGMVPLMPAHAVVEPYNDGSGLVRVTDYSAEGVILAQGDYLNNLREGVYSEFFNTGLLKSTCGYLRGKKQGQMITMDGRGYVVERATYHQDVLHGPNVIYLRNRIKEKRNYDNGILHGEVQKFYPNGVLMEHSNYKDGKLNGVAKWYDQQGNMTIEYTYKDGQLVKDE